MASAKKKSIPAKRGTKKASPRPHEADRPPQQVPANEPGRGHQPDGTPKPPAPPETPPPWASQQ